MKVITGKVRMNYTNLFTPKAVDLEEGKYSLSILIPKADIDTVEKVKEACGKEFVTVTPGIRLASNNADDQVRITTPAKAREIGSDYIVVGRPITQAENPVEAYHLILKEFLGNE